jgi:hypothetical protein
VQACADSPKLGRIATQEEIACTGARAAADDIALAPCKGAQGAAQAAELRAALERMVPDMAARTAPPTILRWSAAMILPRARRAARAGLDYHTRRLDTWDDAGENINRCRNLAPGA